MSWLSDAHSEWHAVHGAYACCPLDCGAISPEQAAAEDLMNFIAYTDEEAGDALPIRCAHCKARHATVDVVRACAELDALGKARDAATT
jgi:hypothetical protein